MNILRRLAPLAALTALPAAVAQAQPSAPARVEQRMEAILSALQPRVQVSGRTYAGESLPELMRHYRVPAVSIAYVEHGRIVWARAYGEADRQASRPATTETLFQAASISKPVAASGALALVERGRLALDRPVNAQLSGWRIPENEHTRAQPVTLRHLLTHTGGLTVHGFPGYEAGAPVPTVTQILEGQPPANTEEVRVDQLPGSAWRYSGGGYTILQLLMLEAGRRPFPELMRRLVLRPLSMDRSSFGPLEASRAAEAASGYRYDGSAIPGRHYVHPELAAAALWTTPSDLARWAIAIGDAYRGQARRPIRPETARQMLTSGMGSWGLGMPVRGEGDALLFEHGGSNQGFRAQMLYLPHRREGIVVMTNGDNGQLIFPAIIQAVGRARGWPEATPHMIEAAAVPAATMRDAVGRYADAEIEVEITLAGERLMMSLDGGPAAELVPQGEDRYIFIDMGFEVKVDRDPPSGRVVSISGAGVTLPRLP